MKIKKIFWLVPALIVALGIGCIVWTAQNRHQDNYTRGEIRYENIPIKKTISESQKEINQLLLTHPIKFINKGYTLEENQTVTKIISILNDTVVR